MDTKGFVCIFRHLLTYGHISANDALFILKHSHSGKMSFGFLPEAGVILSKVQSVQTDTVSVFHLRNHHCFISPHLQKIRSHVKLPHVGRAVVCTENRGSAEANMVKLNGFSGTKNIKLSDATEETALIIHRKHSISFKIRCLEFARSLWSRCMHLWCIFLIFSVLWTSIPSWACPNFLRLFFWRRKKEAKLLQKGNGPARLKFN